jgi:hypothetical protein
VNRQDNKLTGKAVANGIGDETALSACFVKTKEVS